MKKLLTSILAFFVTFLVFDFPGQAQTAGDSIESTVQSLGSRTRAEIAKASERGADSDHALKFQEAGDQALRHGELTRAAEEYGRAAEAIETVDREQATAVQERTRAERELVKAHRSGLATARAEDELKEGNRYLENGEYVDAQMHFHEARVNLAAR
jgi:hypothetical protein